MSRTSAQELSRAVIDSLSPHITDVVLCPGSRNSPLSLEVLARADVRVHVRIDERSAAFLALSLARTQARPVAVVMTSGTAVANCLPAVTEAAHAHIPLIVVSADRPAHLVGTGSSQTINQTNIFGELAPTVGIADAEQVAQLVQSLGEGASQAPRHFNIALDMPLVAPELPEAPNGEATPKKWTHRWLNHGEITVDLNENTLVIAGDEAWEVEGLEEVPTIAEPTAPKPYNPVHPLAAEILLKEQVSAEGYVVNTRPDHVIVVGHPTLHRAVLKLLTDPEIKLSVLSRTDIITDPGRHADQVGSTVKITGTPQKQWLKICSAASELAADGVRDVLEQEDFGFTGLHVAAAVADTLGTGDTLFAAASNAIRDLSVVGMPFDGVDTYSPRGTAGIDGSLSQAIGTALAVQARHPDEIRAPRTVALLGDLAFLHDVGGLLIGPHEPRPENLTIVVSNDNGGGIFELLETGADGLRANFERAFGTPHDASIADLCAGYGIEHREVDNLQDLILALVDTTEVSGFCVIEATTVRDTRRAQQQALTAKVR
ncbi:2-succinyl-5-enolpyruvyl-6-hydroxy-3-cyclohexene-1-carboxylic-acid synthase [Corynebacterium crudilactis]|uniref:2-succinyl-5-enolpyruvyl-6-hydroxy-3-cyclohexene-1-carboxylate synthase n=1 Tax=Corynebacterium crudilactis TaxID=1652495 RepID=A0A172QR94_9CORY|nr:2-succinyl-5-enolpyruvyl-6-hydroxy-3-cyclohexene-1-carboxylic-acid synthase [Corynebacterium crudilactis]ANE03180.1 2-succinyl-5-enolpyruvyl-6-hydroxy-3-cyclohexene-1-carboxylic-acid synthase [Corynebacterium crudilactis]